MAARASAAASGSPEHGAEHRPAGQRARLLGRGRAAAAEDRVLPADALAQPPRHEPVGKQRGRRAGPRPAAARASRPAKPCSSAALRSACSARSSRSRATWSSASRWRRKLRAILRYRRACRRRHPRPGRPPRAVPPRIRAPSRVSRYAGPSAGVQAVRPQDDRLVDQAGEHVADPVDRDQRAGRHVPRRREVEGPGEDREPRPRPPARPPCTARRTSRSRPAASGAAAPRRAARRPAPRTRRQGDRPARPAAAPAPGRRRARRRAGCRRAVGRS